MRLTANEVVRAERSRHTLLDHSTRHHIEFDCACREQAVNHVHGQTDVVERGALVVVILRVADRNVLAQMRVVESTLHSPTRRECVAKSNTYADWLVVMHIARDGARGIGLQHLVTIARATLYARAIQGRT